MSVDKSNRMYWILYFIDPVRSHPLLEGVSNHFLLFSDVQPYGEDGHRGEKKKTRGLRGAATPRLNPSGGVCGGFAPPAKNRWSGRQRPSTKTETIAADEDEAARARRAAVAAAVHR